MKHFFHEMNDFSLFARSYPVDGLATHDTGINQQFFNYSS